MKIRKCSYNVKCSSKAVLNKFQDQFWQLRIKINKYKLCTSTIQENHKDSQATRQDATWPWRVHYYLTLCLSFAKTKQIKYISFFRVLLICVFFTKIFLLFQNNNICLIYYVIKYEKYYYQNLVLTNKIFIKLATQFYQDFFHFTKPYLSHSYADLYAKDFILYKLDT